MPFSAVPWHSIICLAIKHRFLGNQKLLSFFILQIVSTSATGMTTKHLFCQLYHVGRMPRQSNRYSVQNHVINFRKKKTRKLHYKNTCEAYFPEYVDYYQSQVSYFNNILFLSSRRFNRYPWRPEWTNLAV